MDAAQPSSSSEARTVASTAVVLKTGSKSMMASYEAERAS